jgi:uncharacterized protein (DUF4415 family)
MKKLQKVTTLGQPDALFWETAEVIMPSVKQQITLKLAPQIIAYFKQHGRGVNTRINAVLKSYVEKMKPHI